MNNINLRNYKKICSLGKGGFGEVFKVKNINDRKDYAVKQCNFLNDEAIGSISREVNIISKINHPAIIKFIGFSSIGLNGSSSPTFILEFAKNGSLNSILNKSRKGIAPIEWDDTQKYINIFGIAYGMSFLHTKCIIHRDLKPDNILEDENFYPKICDFGLSKIFDPSKPNDQSMIGGTVIYMAPELLADDSNYDISIDVYAYSIILYEIVTGEKPYKEIKNIGNKVIYNYRPLFPDKFPITDNMKKLIENCWSQIPSDRPMFTEIVKTLKNQNFIKNSGFDVDLDKFQDYIEFLETEKNSFYLDKSNIIKTEISSISTIKSSKRKSSVRRDFDYDAPLITTITRGKRSSSVFNRKNTDKKAQTDIQTFNKFPQQNNKNRPIGSIYNRSNEVEIKLYPKSEYLNLPKGLQQKIQEAEKGDSISLIEVINNLIEGKKFFQVNIPLAIKYLQYGIKLQIVECMEIYGLLFLEGTQIPKNELKGVKLLTSAATEFNSDKSKLLLMKYFISKEKTDEDVNYFQAKKYAKELAENGNIEAIVLYGKLCEKTVKNKYGKIEQNFAEAFDYFKLAANRDDAEGLAYYSFYLQYPNGLFTPNIKESIKYLKKSKDKGNAWAMARYGMLKLDGIEVKKDIKKGMELIRKSMDRGDSFALYLYGFCLLNGYFNINKNENEGLTCIEKAALNGNNSAIIEFIRNKEKYHNNVDTNKFRNKLIQNGRTFFYCDKDIFEEFDFKRKSFNKTSLKNGIDMNCTFCMIYYAKMLLKQNKLDEAKKMYKKAADFGDKEAIRKYVKAMKEGKFGIIDTLELQNYNEILKIYNRKYNLNKY